MGQGVGAQRRGERQREAPSLGLGSNFAQLGPNSAHLGPNLAPTSPELGSNLGQLGSQLGKFGITWVPKE